MSSSFIKSWKCIASIDSFTKRREDRIPFPVLHVFFLFCHVVLVVHDLFVNSYHVVLEMRIYISVYTIYYDLRQHFQTNVWAGCTHGINQRQKHLNKTKIDQQGNHYSVIQRFIHCRTGKFCAWNKRLSLLVFCFHFILAWAHCPMY